MASPDTSAPGRRSGASGVFCMLPWTHMAVQTTGGVVPCCAMPPEKTVGDLRRSSLRDVWNGEGMRALRRNMIAGRPSPQCAGCYELEAHGLSSQRQAANEWFAHHEPMVERTRADGGLDSFHLRYLDVRFSNLCNLRCRYCHPGYSSRWRPEWSLVSPDPPGPALLTPTDDPEQLWSQLEPVLPHVERIYFAGGEPLITPECYRILDRLIELGRLEVRMMYNTNLSRTRLKGRDILDLWRRFRLVEVGASLDASGARGEYIRSGLRWDDAVANRRRLMALPNVRFHLHPTLTVMNVLHFPDFLEDWLDQGLIGPGDLSLNVLLGPAEYRVQVLPGHLKQAVQQRYEASIARLRAAHGPGTKAEATLRELLQFMWSEDQSHRLDRFRERTRLLDRSRGERFELVFPELAELVR